MAGAVTPGDTPGFPVTISLPASYRLAGNLTLPAGADGIQARLVAAEQERAEINQEDARDAEAPGACQTSSPSTNACNGPGRGPGARYVSSAGDAAGDLR